MLKLEIRLNAEQISEGGKHTPEVLYGMLIRAFQKEQIDYSEKPDETVHFCRTRMYQRLCMFWEINYGIEKSVLVHGVCRAVDLV